MRPPLKGEAALHSTRSTKRRKNSTVLLCDVVCPGNGEACDSWCNLYYTKLLTLIVLYCTYDHMISMKTLVVPCSMVNPPKRALEARFAFLERKNTPCYGNMHSGEGIPHCELVM